jgi:hypothetical protein
MEAQIIFLEELIQTDNVNDGNYFRVSFKSRVKLNEKTFSFKITDDSKYGSEIEVYDFEGDSPGYESGLLQTYIDTVAPSPNDIVVNDVISFEYEENNGFIEILF